MVEGGKVTWSWFYDRRCEGSVNAPRSCTAAATGRPDVIRINVGHSDGANLTGKSSRHSQTSASFSLGRLLNFVRQVSTDYSVLDLSFTYRFLALSFSI